MFLIFDCSQEPLKSSDNYLIQQIQLKEGKASLRSAIKHLIELPASQGNFQEKYHLNQQIPDIPSNSRAWEGSNIV